MNIEVTKNFWEEDLQDIIRKNGMENVIFDIPNDDGTIVEKYKIDYNPKEDLDIYNPLKETPYKVNLMRVDRPYAWNSYYMSDLASLIKSGIIKISIK